MVLLSRLLSRRTWTWAPYGTPRSFDPAAAAPPAEASLLEVCRTSGSAPTGRERRMPLGSAAGARVGPLAASGTGAFATFPRGARSLEDDVGTFAAESGGGTNGCWTSGTAAAGAAGSAPGSAAESKVFGLGLSSAERPATKMKTRTARMATVPTANGQRRGFVVATPHSVAARLR